jgi:hypothetical protein
MQAWETERYDWSKIPAAGTSAEDVPQALELLRRATNEEEAREAYWRLDNTVVVQGRLHGAALPTAACIVNVLAAAASEVSRMRLLELLQQISDGEPQEGERQIVAAINKEVCRGFGIYAGLLQYGAQMERELCVDLLVSCAHADSELKDRVRFYLERLCGDASSSARVREYAAGRLSQIER